MLGLSGPEETTILAALYELVLQDMISNLQSGNHDLELLHAGAWLQEIAESPQELRRYLAEAAKILLAEPRFLDMLPGFVSTTNEFRLQERLAGVARAG